MDVGFGFQVFPGQCWSCGSGDPNAKRVDFGEYPQGQVRRARIYLCATCITGAASLVADAVGLVVVPSEAYLEDRRRAAEADRLKERAETAEAKLRSLGEHLAAMEGVTS